MLEKLFLKIMCPSGNKVDQSYSEQHLVSESFDFNLHTSPQHFIMSGMYCTQLTDDLQ